MNNELAKRKSAFLSALTKEMKARGFKVSKDVHTVDGINTFIVVQEHYHSSWDRVGSGRLSCNFKINHKRGDRGYTAKEGKKGFFNLTKIADKLEEQVNIRKERNERDAAHEAERNNVKTVVDKLNKWPRPWIRERIPSLWHWLRIRLWSRSGRQPRKL